MDNPITALLMRDWAALGGWGLFLSFIVVWVGIGSFREWWVPGPRHRRTEDLLKKSVELNKELGDQNGKLVAANEITKHFFEEVTPRRNPHSQSKDNGDDDPSKGGVSSG